REVQRWSHLTANHRVRLMAQLALLREVPVSLTGIKGKLEGLTASQKETIAAFMATMAQADGHVSPAEVKILERAYKALDIDPKQVFRDLHAVAAGASAKRSVARDIERTGFKLDPARIAAL